MVLVGFGYTVNKYREGIGLSMFVIREAIEASWGH